MQLDKLKKELISFIESTDNEELLSLVKDDFVFYGKTQGTDITDQLSETQLKELKALSEEEDLKETITLLEFNRATETWRTKS